MTRRPKLSLVPGKEPEKKQMPEFDPEAAGHAEYNTAASKATPSGETEQAPTGQPKPVPARSAKLGGTAQIVKILLVVAATALSLYLVKRRFF